MKSSSKLKNKVLRDVLPHQFFTEFMDTPAARLLDIEITSTHNGSCDTPWPGKQKFVFKWWTLKNGKRVGWNENPARGWSFPILSSQK